MNFANESPNFTKFLLLFPHPPTSSTFNCCYIVDVKMLPVNEGTLELANEFHKQKRKRNFLTTDVATFQSIGWGVSVWKNPQKNERWKLKKKLDRHTLSLLFNETYLRNIIWMDVWTYIRKYIPCSVDQFTLPCCLMSSFLPWNIHIIFNYNSKQNTQRYLTVWLDGLS